MRCSKCGSEVADDLRFCPVCGHKLQSEHGLDLGGDVLSVLDGEGPASARGQLRFQGWTRHGRGSGPYIEACLYALVLLGGVVWYLATGVSWPLYGVYGLVVLVAVLRRL